VESREENRTEEERSQARFLVSVAVVSVYHGNAEKEQNNVVSMLFNRYLPTDHSCGGEVV